MVGVSTFCLTGFCFGLEVAGPRAARRCSGCGEGSDSWAGALRSGSGVGSGTALSPNSRLWTSSAWAENSLNCFHQKLACNFAISNGSRALAKLLARSRPAFKFLCVMRTSWRFTASALWFAASKTFFKKCIVASYSYHSRVCYILPSKFTAVTQLVTHTQFRCHRERALRDIKPLKLGS